MPLCYDSVSLVNRGRTLCASTHPAPAAWKSFCNANIACDGFVFIVSLCIERIFGLRTSHAALQRQCLWVTFVCVMHDPGAGCACVVNRVVHGGVVYALGVARRIAHVPVRRA